MSLVLNNRALQCLNWFYNLAIVTLYESLGIDELSLPIAWLLNKNNFVSVSLIIKAYKIILNNFTPHTSENVEKKTFTVLFLDIPWEFCIFLELKGS